MKTSLYEQITQQIVAAIEAGTSGYRMPWHRTGGIGAPMNAISGRAYRGINTLLLWAEATRADYASGEWATYRQWATAGAQVRKGARSTVVLLWKPVKGRHDADEGDQASDRRMFARAFRVFNADQVDGYVSTGTRLNEADRAAAAGAFFAAQPAEIWHGSDDAFYDPASDSVSMPSFGRFVSPGAYYGVLAHELIHWTGAKRRLDRDLSGRFGSNAYAMEELVAELGAAFIAGHLELAAEPREDHAAYISSWLKVLKDDPRPIITAASSAQAGADYLIGAAERRASTTADRIALVECAA
jgi:antirestriction protein ArdC